MKNIRVLIVDDSLLFREMLQQELERDINIQVVAKAADAFEASKKITTALPDVLVADVIMERMSGIEFVRQLLPQYFMPVILISSDSSKRQEAEKIGSAVSFFEKPPEGAAQRSREFFDTLRAKIRSIANQETFSPEASLRVGEKLIAIGASTGGAEAIENVLIRLPSMMPPLLIAQHMPPKFTKTFAERLNTSCKISVKEAEDGDVVIPGQAYVAPGGLHMMLRRRQDRFVISCEENKTGTSICPCIDMMFQSIAAVAASRSIGVLLTGMGKDGADGLKQMHDAGSQTIGQDESSSIIYGMPKAAFDIGAVDLQLPLSKISAKLVELSTK